MSKTFKAQAYVSNGSTVRIIKFKVTADSFSNAQDCGWKMTHLLKQSNEFIMDVTVFEIA